MVIRKGYKFRLMPDHGVSAMFVQFSGINRFVWNKALALQKSRLIQGVGLLNKFELKRMLPVWKSEESTRFIKNASAQSLQAVILDLSFAIYKAFDKSNPASFPKFKKKGLAKDSFSFQKDFKLDQINSRICLPKIGWVRYRNSRVIEGTPKNVTVSRDGEHWNVSIQVEVDVPDPAHLSSSSVGIDMGVSKFATLSDGQVFESVNAFRNYERKLRNASRSMSRKVIGSSNYKKAAVRMSKAHRKIRNIRADFLHKTSSIICKNHAILFVEDLNVRNMSKSAKGSLEKPGKSVKQKSGLNKSILDQGWGEFFRQLEYKQLWLGGRVVKVNPAYTSQTCSYCGLVDSDNRKTQASFSCVACGFHSNADLNAASNIKAAGHAVLSLWSGVDVMTHVESGTSQFVVSWSDRLCGRQDVKCLFL